MAYILLHDADWENCIAGPESGSPICVEDGDPIEVLNAMSAVYSVIDSKNTVVRDIVIVLVMALVFKVLFVIGVIYKTKKVASF